MGVGRADEQLQLIANAPARPNTRKFHVHQSCHVPTVCRHTCITGGVDFMVGRQTVMYKNRKKDEIMRCRSVIQSYGRSRRCVTSLEQFENHCGCP